MTVRVPANYVVWGTGTLVNAAEVLQPAVLQRFQASQTSDQAIHVATAADLRARAVTAQQPVNTWHFTAANVPDVTYALSDHYVWDAGSVVVDDRASRRASVQAAYNDTAADYRHMVRYASHALDWLSHQWPGVPYPYEKTTVVQGPAGMEYPMMANDESYADTSFSRFVAEHEIAHSYFPFYMGINETRYGFMDEGMTTAIEYLRNTVNFGRQRADSFFKQFRGQAWVVDNADGGSRDHHPEHHGRQRVRQAGTRLSRAQGDARRLAVSRRAPRVHRALARQAPHAVGLLLYVRRRDAPPPRLVLAAVVLH